MREILHYYEVCIAECVVPFCNEGSPGGSVWLFWLRFPGSVSRGEILTCGYKRGGDWRQHYGWYGAEIRWMLVFGPRTWWGEYTSWKGWSDQLSAGGFLLMRISICIPNISLVTKYFPDAMLWCLVVNIFGGKAGVDWCCLNHPQLLSLLLHLLSCLAQSHSVLAPNEFKGQ